MPHYVQGPPFKFTHTPHKHANFVNCVRCSPDGSRFASVVRGATLVHLLVCLSRRLTPGIFTRDAAMLRRRRRRKECSLVKACDWSNVVPYVPGSDGAGKIYDGKTGTPVVGGVRGTGREQRRGECELESGCPGGLG